MTDTNSTRIVNRFFSIIFGVVFFLLIAISAVSDMIVGFSPELALKINPMNSAARMNTLSSQLFSKTSSDQFMEIENSANQGIRFEPFDARFYSLLGVVRNQENNPDAARELFRHSLKLLPVEIQALRQLFVFNVRNGNSKKAIEYADFLVRRWPVYRSQVAQYVPILLKNKEAYSEAIRRFPLQIDGVKFIINALLADKSSYGLATKMLLEWRSKNVPNLQPQINSTTKILYQSGQNQNAYRFFYLTLSDAERKEAGYIYNGKFKESTSNNIFNWKLVSKSGLNMKISPLASKFGGNHSKQARALKFEFGDAPVKLVLRAQVLNLPQSKFNFKVVYSTENFKGPRPFEISIICTNGRLLTSLKLEPQNNQVMELNSHFNVAEQGCSNQALFIRNGEFAESWNNRFDGSIYLHEVSLVLSDL